MKHKNVKSLEYLKEKRVPIVNTKKKHKTEISKLNKIALKITEKVGSMGFFVIIFVWTATWLAWNSLGPVSMRFDPFPAFVLWLFISNMVQIFLMPLIMIGQNLQSAHSEIRAEQDFKINVKAESEIETILMHLENQNEVMIKILKKLEDNEK